MAIFARKLRPSKGTVTNGHIALFGKLVIGNTGAITSQSCDGFSVVRAAAGQYTVTLDGTVTELLCVSVCIIGPDSAEYDTAGGLCAFVRADAVSSTGVFKIQFAEPAGAAGADIDDAALAILIRIDLKQSTVNP